MFFKAVPLSLQCACLYTGGEGVIADPLEKRQGVLRTPALESGIAPCHFLAIWGFDVTLLYAFPHLEMTPTRRN